VAEVHGLRRRWESGGNPKGNDMTDNIVKFPKELPQHDHHYQRYLLFAPTPLTTKEWKLLNERLIWRIFVTEEIQMDSETKGQLREFINTLGEFKSAAQSGRMIREYLIKNWNRWGTLE
jgi:hypothetical protein